MYKRNQSAIIKEALGIYEHGMYGATENPADFYDKAHQAECFYLAVDDGANLKANMNMQSAGLESMKQYDLSELTKASYNNPSQSYEEGKPCFKVISLKNGLQDIDQDNIEDFYYIVSPNDPNGGGGRNCPFCSNKSFSNSYF